MTDSIIFPHIGIELNNVGQYLNVFGYDIAFYGMVIGVGMLTGIMLAVIEAKKTGQNPDHYYDLGLYGIIFAIMGARLYYVVFSWSDYKDNLIKIFNLRQGGLAIYGGVIAGAIVFVVYTKVKKLSTLLILDTAVPSLIMGQAIGRWGNFFNREAFGEYTDSILAMQIPLDRVRTSDVTELMLENITYIDGVEFIQVHPTFLYESLWCIGVFLIMILYRRHKKFDGEILLIYLGGYGAGRFWIEGLRTDQLQLSSGYAVSQLLAGVLAIVSVIVIIAVRTRINKKNKM